MFSKKRFLFSLSFFTVVLLLFYALGAAAISLDDVKQVADDGGLFICGADDGGFVCIATTILQILLSLAFIIAIIFIVISGYRFITSQGNEQAVTAAKRNLTWAIAGIVLIVLAWILLAVIVRTFQTGEPGSSSNNGPSFQDANRSPGVTDPGGPDIIE